MKWAILWRDVYAVTDDGFSATVERCDEDEFDRNGGPKTTDGWRWVVGDPGDKILSFGTCHDIKTAKRAAIRALRREMRRAWKPDRRWKDGEPGTRYPFLQLDFDDGLYSATVSKAWDREQWMVTWYLGNLDVKCTHFDTLAAAQYEAERRLRLLKEALA